MTKDDPKATSGETSPAAAEKVENEKEAAATTSTPTSSTPHKASTPRTREALRVFKLKGGLCEVEGCEQKSLEDAASSNKDGDNEEDEGKKHLCQNHLDNGEDTPSEPVKRGRKRKSDKDDDDDDDDDNEDPKKNKPSGEEAAVETTDMDTEEKDSPPATPGTTSTDVCTPATTPGSVTRSGFKSCEIIGCEKLRARGGYCLRHFKDKTAAIRSGTTDYERRICDIKGCERLRSKGKYCHRHNNDATAPIRNKSDGPVDRKKQCSIENCDRLQVKGGFCSRHFKDKDAPVLATPAFSFDADARWDELFPQLKAFYDKNGHSRVPTSQKTDLARFVTHIRCVYRTKKQKVVKVDPDGDDANATPAAATPAAEAEKVDEEMSEDTKTPAAAVEIVAEDPKDSTDVEVVVDPDIAAELVHPDLSRSKLLTPERMEALKTVGFEFQLWTVEPSQWEQRFNELLAYKKKNGNFHVTNKQNSTLSSWCKTQRQRYKNTMAIYQGLYGVELSNPQKKAKELYEKAKEKAAELKSGDNAKNGIAPTLSDIGEAKNMMDPERICKLNAVGFEWELQKDTYVESWENRYNQLLKFKVLSGHCRVPKSSGDNPQLGQWVKQMRKYHGWKEDGKPFPTTFTDERIARLNELGFEWRLKDTPLKGMKSEDGHVARLPNNTADVTLQQLHGGNPSTPSNSGNSDNATNTNDGNNNESKQNWNNWYGGFEGGASV